MYTPVSCQKSENVGLYKDPVVFECDWSSYNNYPVDNFGTVVGENPTPYGNLALWAVNGLSIVYWVCMIGR